MEMTGEQRIAASRQAVWEALNDAEILRQCIPGADTVEKLSDTEFAATVTAKVGPVKAKFKGNVTLSDLDPPNGYTIAGEGKGGAAGFGKGEAQVTLAEDGDATILSYAVKATVGGKLAQLGSRLIDGVAKKMAGDFFTAFNELVSAEQAADAAPAAAPEQTEAPPPSAAPTPAPTPSQSGTNPWVWIAGVVVLILLALYFFFGGTDGG